MTRPEGIRQAIHTALANRSAQLRREATSRALTGPAYIQTRATLRKEAQWYNDLARVVEVADAQALAVALGIHDAVTIS